MKSSVKSLFLASFLCSCLLSSSIADNPCNDYVDNVLNHLKANAEFFEEPYEIPDVEKSFGLYRVEEGYVYGLNTIHRDGEVVPVTESRSKGLKVTLVAGELSLKCSGKKKLFHIGPPIVVEANVPYVEVEFSIVLKSGSSSLELKDFNVAEIKGLTAKISGLGVLRNTLHNAYLRLIKTFLKRNIRRGIEDRLMKFLQSKVKQFSIPSQCL